MSIPLPYKTRANNSLSIFEFLAQKNYLPRGLA